MKTCVSILAAIVALALGGCEREPPNANDRRAESHDVFVTTWEDVCHEVAEGPCKNAFLVTDDYRVYRVGVEKCFFTVHPHDVSAVAQGTAPWVSRRLVLQADTEWEDLATRWVDSF